MTEARGDKPGLGIYLPVFEQFARFFVSERAKERFASEMSESFPSLFCHERPERIAHGHSFVKSGGSESLKSLFKKEQMSEERRE